MSCSASSFPSYLFSSFLSESVSLIPSLPPKLSTFVLIFQLQYCWKFTEKVFLFRVLFCFSPSWWDFMIMSAFQRMPRTVFTEQGACECNPSICLIINMWPSNYRWCHTPSCDCSVDGNICQSRCFAYMWRWAVTLTHRHVHTEARVKAVELVIVTVCREEGTQGSNPNSAASRVFIWELLEKSQTLLNLLADGCLYENIATLTFTF